MNIQTRLSFLVAVITVIAMFFIIKSVPLLNNSVLCSHEYIAKVVVILTSVGTYITFAKILFFLLARWRWLKKRIFGAAYLEGTWVGQLEGKTGKIYTIIEHYEQNPYDLVIRGRSFEAVDKPHAQWHSVATKIALDDGLLFCFYLTRIFHRSAAVEGIGHYQLLRTTPSAAPSQITGYVTDVDNGKLMQITKFKKIDDDMLEWADAYTKYWS